MQDSVSVIIPTYNRRENVSRAIDSVLSQTSRPTEVIVVDDGSNDGTKEFLSQTYGRAIQLISQQNRGAAAARNSGILHSTGDMIAFLDSDDVWDRNKLSSEVSALEKSDAVLVYSNYAYRDRDGDRFSEAGLVLPLDCTVFEQPLVLLTREGDSGVHLCGTLCRRRPLLDVGMFDANLRIAEDTKFFFAMARQGPFAVLRQPLWTRTMASDSIQLTKPRDDAYQREHTRVIVGLFESCLAAEPTGHREVRRNLRRLLGYFAMRQARFHAVDGHFSDARSRAIASIRYSPFRSSTVLRSAFLASAPRLARWLIQRRHVVSDQIVA